MLIEIKSNKHCYSKLYTLTDRKLEPLRERETTLQHTIFVKNFQIKTDFDFSSLDIKTRKNINKTITQEIKNIIKKDIEKKIKFQTICKKKKLLIKNNIKKSVQESFNNLQYEKILNKFLNTLRHEITNPVTGMRLASNFLCQNSNKTASEISNDILTSAQKIVDLIDKCNMKDCHSSVRLINDIVHSKKNQNPNIEFLTDLNEDLILKNGKEIFEQIIINLINNAIEAMSNANKPRIEISTSLLKNKFQLSIHDNGDDVSDAKLLFSPYYTTKKNGSGLGLYICKKYCKELGLEIEIKTKPKKVFIIKEL